MIDEHDLDQPWVAPNAPKFKIGDRVKVHLSAECPIAHHPIDDGRTGVIVTFANTVPSRLKAAQHGLLVMFDEPFAGHGGTIFGVALAPNELELLP